ncbi:MAG: hypothetical protein AAF899_10215 [Pseudomonadota bacterium]
MTEHGTSAVTPYTGPAIFHLGHIKTASTFLQQRVFGVAGTGTGIPGGALTRRHLVGELVACDPFAFDAAALATRLEALEAPVRAQGLVPVWSDEVLIGDPCQRAYHGRAVADRILAIGRPLRVLIVVREQRSFAWSAYRQYVSNGGVLALSDFVGRPGLPVSHTPILRPDYLEFDGAIGFWRKAVGGENLLVLPYEMLRGDPAGFIAAIAGLIGVEAFSVDASESLNVGDHAATIGLRRLANGVAPVSPLGDPPSRLRRALLGVARRIGHWAPRPLHRQAERKAKAMIADTYGDRFAASNGRLAAMTGLDLARWGYPVAEASRLDQPRTSTGSAPMVEGSSTARTR